MAVTIDEIKKLRDLTGVGLTDAKRALEEVDGDFDKALEQMRIKGMSRAEKKSDRAAAEGIIESYVHNEKIGVLVELNCETDFVARTDDFKRLARDLALHIAATNPKFKDIEDVDQAALAKEKELVEAELKEQGKPAEMVAKISEGKINKWYSEVCLMRQAFVKNPDQSIEELVKETAAKLGENLVVGQFSRIELGGN
jgi:elongation factor Ts